MKFTKTDGILGGLLGLAALILRLIFRSRYLYHWDSVNFALSLEQYDVRLHQPHPPGYILYSMLGKVFNAFLHDPNLSLVWISVIAGVGGVVVIYFCASEFYGRRAGLIAALILIVNPLHWFNSEVALSYSLEFALVPLWIILCYRQIRNKNLPGNNWLYISILLGLMGGVRQNDLIFLFPLWLYCLLGMSWKKRLISCLVLGIVVLLWLVPMALLSGGVQGYLEALMGETSGVVQESPLSSIVELGSNAGRLAIYIGYASLLGVIPLMLQLFQQLQLLQQNRSSLKSVLADKRTWIFILWVGPAFLFYLFIHIRQPGHIFIFFPAITMVIASSAETFGCRLDNLLKKQAVRVNEVLGTIVVVGGIVLANLLFFVFAPPALLGSQQLALQTPSRQTIQQHDIYLAERLQYIRAHFNPATTVVLAGGLNYRHPDFYLRDYQLTNLSYRVGSEPLRLPENVKSLVFFDQSVLSKFTVPDGIQSFEFPATDTALYYLSWDGTNQVFVNTSHVEITGEK
jgi:hypothetical protein